MIKHWRRNAALKAMPTINPNAVRTPWHEFWRRFRRQHVALVAGLFVLLLVAAALFAPYLTPFDAENYFDYDRLNEGPSLVHWLGVDSLGRDIFSRILMGTRISLAAGVFSVLAGGLIGTLLGLLAGYYEGWWDRITMRICDVLFAFPGILLAIGVVAIMGSGMANVIIAVAIFSIPAFARLVRVIPGAEAPDLYRVGTQHRRFGLDHHRAAYFAGHSFVDCGVFHHAYRHFHHYRRQPVVPWPGRAAADAGVGRDAQRGASRYGDCAARGDFPQFGDFPHRAGVQPVGRRAARCAGSETEGVTLGLLPLRVRAGFAMMRGAHLNGLTPLLGVIIRSISRVACTKVIAGGDNASKTTNDPKRYHGGGTQFTEPCT